jgi:hypothetical protein
MGEATLAMACMSDSQQPTREGRGSEELNCELHGSDAPAAHKNLPRPPPSLVSPVMELVSFSSSPHQAEPIETALAGQELAVHVNTSRGVEPEGMQDGVNPMSPSSFITKVVKSLLSLCSPPQHQGYGPKLHLLSHDGVVGW